MHTHSALWRQPCSLLFRVLLPDRVHVCKDYVYSATIHQFQTLKPTKMLALPCVFINLNAFIVESRTIIFSINVCCTVNVVVFWALFPAVGIFFFRHTLPLVL